MSESCDWALANYRQLTSNPRPMSEAERENQKRDEERSRTNLRIRRKLPKVV